jgi:hypothetical protein
MLELSPTLSDAQDELIRHPIVELVSTQPVPAIPFDGEYFNSSDTPESHPNLISHSTGRMVAVYVRDRENLIFMYTDGDRTMWTEVVVDLSLVSNHSIEVASMCELPNGNIGVIVIDLYLTTYTLQYMVFNVEGEAVTSRTNVGVYTSPNIIVSPFVYLLQDDSFLLVYSHYDGTDYSIFKRTSSDFVSWSASSSITLSGFDKTCNTDHPSLIQVDSGDILLFVDYVNLKSEDNITTNIYKLKSTDNGVTWGVPSQMTSYTDWGSGGIHPYPAITNSNIIKLSFHETNSILSLDSDSTGWENECVSPEHSAGASIHFDPVTEKLYVKQIQWGVSTKSLCGVVVIDTENMVLDRNYNTSTVPDYSDLFLNDHVWYGAKKYRSEGKYTVAASYSQTNTAVVVIDDSLETITTYVFKENGTYGDLDVNVKGVDGRTEMWENNYKIFGTWVDEANHKLYVGMAFSYAYQPYILVGSIDLTEEEDPVDGYTFTEIAWITSWSEVELTALFSSSGGLLVIKELNRFCLYGMTAIDYWRAKFGVYDLSTGSVITEYSQDESPGFPYQGIGHCVYNGNHVYGRITYSTKEGQSVHRGLCDINIINGTITCHRPSYQAVDDYRLLDAVIMDSENIAFADFYYGIAVFNVSDESWTLYNGDVVSGFDSYYLTSIDYDAVKEVFYVGSTIPVLESGFAGIRAISTTGSFNKGKYTVGTLSEGLWDFNEISDLSIGLAESDFVLAVDNVGVLWSLWVRKDVSYYSIKWDKEQANLDLTPYLLGAVDVVWDIESSSSLSFTLSYGHLFDINNSLSTLYIFVKKGRSITLRFGETVDGVEYWQNQGTFYIKTTRVSYSKGKYPSLSVSCEDKLSLFEDIKIMVSDYYDEQYPEDLIRHLVPIYTGLELEDISIDDFDTRHTIWYQILDKSLRVSIQNILDHFGYFLRMDVDNKLSTRKVRTSVDSVDHSYSSDANTIINFSPDDNFSSNINRVIVTGELRDPIEVLYAEEVVGSVAGSGGWWSSKSTTETVYFSEDEERKCRDIRLEIIISIEDFEILWQESGGTEYISYYDPNELYIEITIEFPGLIGVLIGLLLTVIALGVAAVNCYLVCGPYIMAISVVMSAIGYVLGQVANYEYEVYGRPVGEVKQTVQAIADDEEFQTYIDLVLSKEINDEFCYSVPSCQTVADFELAIIMAQRKRVSFSKITHLQDEVGDIISIFHPYSNQELNLAITSLRRRFTKGKSGSFIDTVEGWNI